MSLPLHAATSKAFGSCLGHATADSGLTTTPRQLRRIVGASLLTYALSVASVTPTHADLTLNGFSQVTTLNQPHRSQEVLYLRKDRLRRDVIERGRNYTYLYDLKQRELTIIDHLFRQAEVRQLEAGEPRSGVDNKEVKVELAATGRTHELAPWVCVEHRVKARLPGSLGQEQVVLNLEGQVWVAPNTAEQRHLTSLLKALPSQDLFVGLPMQGRTAPTQVQRINEVLRRILPKGMLCAFDVSVDYEGSGPMANLARRMATRVSLVYEQISNAALKDDLFEIPAGYRVIRP